MNFASPMHPNISTATIQVVAAVSQYVTTVSQALQSSLEPKPKYMHARRVVLHELGFESENRFSRFKNRLQREAEYAWKLSEINDCLSRKPCSCTNYYAFHALLGLSDDCEEQLGGRSVRVISIGPSRTTWLGYGDDAKKTDLRVAGLVDPAITIKRGELANVPTLVIESELELFAWAMCFGGVALVPKKLAETNHILSEWLSPYSCTREGLK
ncbi:MAG: hypothetical protein ABW072_10390 [Sedimenticola sp.]